MTRFILILDDNLERQYQEAVRFLAHWHEYPTQLKNIPGDDSQKYNYSYPRPRQPRPERNRPI